MDESLYDDVVLYQRDGAGGPGISRCRFFVRQPARRCSKEAVRQKYVFIPLRPFCRDVVQLCAECTTSYTHCRISGHVRLLFV